MNTRRLTEEEIDAQLLYAIATRTGNAAAFAHRKYESLGGWFSVRESTAGQARFLTKHFFKTEATPWILPLSTSPADTADQINAVLRRMGAKPICTSEGYWVVGGLWRNWSYVLCIEYTDLACYGPELRLTAYVKEGWHSLHIGRKIMHQVQGYFAEYAPE